MIPMMKNLWHFSGDSGDILDGEISLEINRVMGIQKMIQCAAGKHSKPWKKTGELIELNLTLW
jgi:hypothetical protein